MRLTSLAVLLAVVTLAVVAVLALRAPPQGAPLETESAPTPPTAVAEVQRRQDSATAREEAVTPQRDPPLPWSVEALAAQPMNALGQATGVRPFLHQGLNTVTTAEQVRNGSFSWYKVDLDKIISDLPSEQVRADAQSRIKELRDLISEHIASSYALEIEYWRVQTLDLHHAVEKGEFVVVDHSPGDDDKIKAAHNRTAIERLLAGRHEGRDLIYRSMSSRPRDSAPHTADAFVYLRRELFPQSFTLLEELLRTRRSAANVVRRRLGVPDMIDEPVPIGK